MTGVLLRGEDGEEARVVALEEDEDGDEEERCEAVKEGEGAGEGVGEGEGVEEGDGEGGGKGEREGEREGEGRMAARLEPEDWCCSVGGGVGGGGGDWKDEKDERDDEEEDERGGRKWARERSLRGQSSITVVSLKHSSVQRDTSEAPGESEGGPRDRIFIAGNPLERLSLFQKPEEKKVKQDYWMIEMANQIPDALSLGFTWDKLHNIRRLNT